MTIGDSLRPLTKDQIALLKESFRMMDSDKLAMRFYTSLFAKYPEVKPLFPGDLTELSTKIVSVFELVVHSFEATSENEFVLQRAVIRPLRALGELHSQKGVEDKYYPWVNEMLIQSISKELANRFSHEAEVAWKLALNHLTFAMLSDVKIEPGDQHETMRDSFNHIRSLLFTS
jgi:hemoglobin-like flavoprotein